MDFNPPLYDNFTGPDGSIDGRLANPGQGVWEAPAFTGHTAATIVSNDLTGSGGADRSGVILTDYPANIQVAATYSTVDSAVFLYARIQEDAFPATQGDMYYLRATVVGGTNDDTLSINRFIGGVGSTLATFPIAGDFAVGDSFGMSLYEQGGSTLGGIWFRTAAAQGWQLIGTYSDSQGGRPTAAGHVGVEIGNSPAAISSFFVGNQLDSPADVPVLGISGRGAGW